MFRPPWTRQPQYPAIVDEASPFAVGLAFAWNGAHPSIDLRTRAPMQVTGAIRGVSSRGIGHTFTPAGTNFAQGDAPRVNRIVKNFSMIAIAAPSTSATQMKMFASVGLVSTGGNHISLAANMDWNGTASSGRLGAVAAVGGWYTSSHVDSWIDGAPHVFGVTRLGGVASTATAYAPLLYRDGQPAAASSRYVFNTSDPDFTSFDKVRIGNRAIQTPGTVNTYDEASGIQLVLMWNRVLTAAEMAEIADNPWQIFAPLRQRLYTFAGGGAPGHELAGAASATASATATLTTGIALGGSAPAIASAAGALTTGIPLEVAASVNATATGALTAQIRFEGAALAAAVASAALSTGIPLQGAATAVAIGTATLTTQIPLQGAAAAVATAIASLGGGVALAGAAQAVALGTGALSTGITLQGAAVSAATANGTLTVGVTLSGAALAQAIAQGGLTTAIQLSANAGASASAAATLDGVMLTVDPRYALDDERDALLIGDEREAFEVRDERGAFEVMA